MSKHEHGYSVVADPGSDIPLFEQPSTQCVHCGGHFPLPSFGTDALSKKLRIGRGWCSNCNGFICGEKCIECKPWERKLEEDEGTKNPTAVSNVKRDPSGIVQSTLWLPPDCK